MLEFMECYLLDYMHWIDNEPYVDNIPLDRWIKLNTEYYL